MAVCIADLLGLICMQNILISILQVAAAWCMCYGDNSRRLGGDKWCLFLQANPMQQSWDKRTPLHFAAQHRHPTVIRQLLFHPSLRQNPTSALRHPSGFALQDLPVQPALQQHQQALYTNGHQAQDISEAVLPNLPLSLHKPYNAQIEVQNSKQADLVSGHASIQDAASSLQSLQSGIQYEPYAAGTTSRQEPDTRSNSSVDSAEELDYTGEDAHAMEALLALTSDCSVQSPSQSQNPAGKRPCEANHPLWIHSHIPCVWAYSRRHCQGCVHQRTERKSAANLLKRFA